MLKNHDKPQQILSLAGTRRQFSRSGDLRTFFRLAGTASAATNWPDGQPIIRPLNTLLLTAEEGISDAIRPRFRIADGDRSRFFVLSHIPADDGPRLPSIPSPHTLVATLSADHLMTGQTWDLMRELGDLAPSRGTTCTDSTSRTLTSHTMHPSHTLAGPRPVPWSNASRALIS